MASYLITGIAGFIGSSLAHALAARGKTVRGIDNFSTGRRENLRGIESKIELIELDIAEYSPALEKACQGVDYVLHQAALPSVPRSLADPLSSNRCNVDGTLHVLLAAKKAWERKQLKRVIYAASSSAYGDTPTLPKREDMQPNPISPYAVAKLAGEFYMQSFWRSYGMETVSLRYFNVFGPRQDPSSQYSGVIAKFILAMLRNQQPTIYGDGTQSRDFTYIDNVISANLLACGAPAEHVAGRVFNIACGERIDLKQLFATLKKITAYAGEAGFGAPRAGDIMHSLADMEQAHKQLGYRTLVGFEDGLRRTVEWYKQEAQPSSAAHSPQR